METHKRSIAKALSWRVCATIITINVAYLITGDGTLALEIGVLDTLIKLLIYYGHERAWLFIAYGKPKTVPPPEYQI